MKRRIGCVMIWLILAGAMVWGGGGDDAFEKRLANISRSEMQAAVEFLGHDLLEGRAPGSRGGDLAEIYTRSLCKFMGLEPGAGESYFQPFDLAKITTSGIRLEARGETLDFKKDIVGTCTLAEKAFTISGPAVFVGFGIKADAWDWDDFKDRDLAGKIVITRVNDPGFFLGDLFEGRMLTYFGRWTCHIEEAARRGARAILMIHTTGTAGYDWNVVKNSWTGGEFFLPSELSGPPAFRGWIREEALKRILPPGGPGLEDLYAASLSRSFRPVDLGIGIRISGRNERERITNRNVVAVIPGRVPQRIVLSAHIDHLGKSDGEGDVIFNGAIDNGSAVAAMLVTAGILKEFQKDLYYTTAILACNSEEAGLLGSRYYVDTADRSRIVANINFESTPVWKPSTTLMGIGARFSTFRGLIRRAAEEMGLGVSEFSLADQGLFYRSDQFSFARRGIPAVWISAGEEEVDGQRHYTQFWRGDYHTVRDEYSRDWDLGGMRQTIQAALRIIRRVNDTRTPPRWEGTLTFPIEKEVESRK